MQLIGPYTAALDRALQEKIEQWHLSDKVIVTGRMDWVQAMHIVSKSSLGLCLLMPVPNYTTCLATKILEYMMVGTPVLASRFECWRPYVEGEQVGMMADPQDLDEVTAQCKRILDDHDQWHRMSRKGRAAVREKYNWDQEFQQLLRCYASLLDYGKTCAAPIGDSRRAPQA
jgi:glycosyltransferase involved in cell wall biosynthesis